MYTSQVRDAWHLYRCTSGVRTANGFFGRHPVYAANADVEEAWKALEEGHIGAGYVPTDGGYIGSKRSCPSGIGGRTCQQSGKDCSLHNYCLALDIEYQYNKYIRSRVTPEDFDEDWFPAVCKYRLDEIYALEGIKNVQGEQLFTWLGWAIGDFMHWQINVPPERCTVDWNTVPVESVEEEDMTLYQDLLDEWTVQDLEGFEALGWWSGSPGAAENYYKNEENPPHPDDVKRLVTQILAASAVASSEESIGDGDVVRRGESVVLS